MNISRPSALAGAATLAAPVAMGATLGTTFATGGVETGLPGQGSAIAVQPTGDMVAAGELEETGQTPELAVQRYRGS